MPNDRRKILELFEKNKEYVDKRVDHDIKKYRMGDFKIKFTDEKGNPIKNKNIKVTQKTHEFKYGANIFMLDEFESEDKNKLYREYFKEAFNTATLPFYWKDLEPQEGNLRFKEDSPKIYRRPNIDLCLSYCNENNITPKEHCLVYEPWRADWLDDTNEEEIKEKYEKRMKILSENYADKINCWEVINETLVPQKNPSVFYKNPEMVEWSFACAEKYFKNNELLINETHHNIWNAFTYNRSQYYMQIERALNKGARIDGIGMQYHMFYKKEEEYDVTREYYNPLILFDLLDTYKDFNLPLQITEVTIPAYSDSKEDEEIQAEIIKILYSIWFSHPNMEAVIYWNLVDGYAAWAPQGDMTAGENYFYGGLIRFDMTPKPAFYTIKDLFTKVWHTELILKTDDDGCINFKGFYGDYDIFLNDKNVSVSLLKKNKRDITVTI